MPNFTACHLARLMAITPALDLNDKLKPAQGHKMVQKDNKASIQHSNVRKASEHL
jgi:hypothetical protein